MKMKKLFFLYFLFAVIVLLPGQTAEKLEELLNTPAVSYEQAAWLILEAADVWDLSGTGAPGFREAFNAAAERRWLPGNAGSGDNARLDGISLLFMESFGLKGGLFYKIFRNPHYAYRELVYQEIIPGRIDPAMAVSGDMLVYMTGRVLSELENTGWSPVHSIRPKNQGNP